MAGGLADEVWALRRSFRCSVFAVHASAETCTGSGTPHIQMMIAPPPPPLLISELGSGLSGSCQPAL